MGKIFKSREEKKREKELKKTEYDMVVKDKERIALYVKQLDSYINLYSSNLSEDTVQMMLMVKNEFEQMSPIAVIKDTSYDKKIDNLLDDVKIELSKKNIDEDEITGILKKIRVLRSEKEINN